MTVPLNDALTTFKIVAVADASTGLFGTGSTSIRATQDLQIISGLPPLVREDDQFRAQITLRKPAIVEGLKAPRVSSKTVVVLSPDEVARFLGGFRLPIYFAIASLLFGTGMRLGEALAVTVDDIDAARGVITVRHTKTRRPRVVRLTPELLRRLRDYWRATRPTRPLLFPGTDPTRHLDSSAVQKVFKRVATEVGLGKRVTPHVLRHTYATHMLEAGVDIHTVQLLLGHATLYMTLRYLHLSTAHLAGRQTPLPPLLAG